LTKVYTFSNGEAQELKRDIFVLYCIFKLRRISVGSEAGFSMLQFNIDTLKKESAYYISFTLLVIIRKKGEKSTSLKKPSSLKYKKLDRG
jgi:hypothetical protein